MLLRRYGLLFGCAWFAVSATAARRAARNSPQQKPNAIIVVAPQKLATLADFAWLTGRWEGPLRAPGSDKPPLAEQEWMAPKHDTMQGMFRLSTDQKTILLEFFTLRETPDGLFFYFRHFSPELVPQEKEEAYRLKLAKSEAGRFQFDNTVENTLKDVVLTLVDSDHYLLHGDLSGSDGKPAVIEVPYQRVK